MFEIGQGRELLKEEFTTIIRISSMMSFIGLLLIMSVNAEQSFPTTIKITTFYVNNSYTLHLNGSDIAFSTITANFNITTEQDVHTYNCISNYTSSFIFDLKRNTTSIDATNLTASVSNLASTCENIAKAYGDTNRYYDLYATCNKDLGLCQIEKDDKTAKVNELSPFKPNFEKCSKDLSDTQLTLNKYSNEIIPLYQQNVTSCISSMDKSEKGKLLYGFFGFLIASAIFLIIERKKFKTTYREKQVGLGRH